MKACSENWIVVCRCGKLIALSETHRVYVPGYGERLMHGPKDNAILREHSPHGMAIEQGHGPVGLA